MQSGLLALLSLMSALAAGNTAHAGDAAAPARVEPSPPREAPANKLRCMTTKQWLEETTGQKLRDPFQCMRETALHHQAEALGARLCRLGDLLLYEIKLLTPNGHVQKVLVDAVSGRPVPGVAEK